MNLSDKKLLVIGGGVAGLSAALEATQFNISVDIVEKSPSFGGHAIQFSCKAADECAKCGACLAQEKLSSASENRNIRFLPNSRVTDVKKTDGFLVTIETNSINNSSTLSYCKPDAIIVASGFDTFNPCKKPYGYGLFRNVVTSLEVEKMLRQNRVLKRVSDNYPAKKIAFIQCVGSRDASLNHLWCSQICCGLTLRIANIIKKTEPDSEITIFYIDMQTSAGNLEKLYSNAVENFKMIRTIPGDIFQTQDDQLKVSFYDNTNQKEQEEVFDLVVLCVGIMPKSDNKQLSDLLDLPIAESGFFHTFQDNIKNYPDGVFTAGTANGPMSIASSIADAGSAALEAIKFFSI